MAYKELNNCRSMRWKMKLSKAQIATLEKIEKREVVNYLPADISKPRKWSGARKGTIEALTKMGLIQIIFSKNPYDGAWPELTEAGRAALEEVRK